MKRIVDVVKLVGKRGLSYRGSNEEAACTLQNEEIDHRNFLEVVKLVRKHDSCTADHFSHVVQNRKKQHEKAKSSRGRVSLVTLLSKTRVNFVITIIQDKVSVDSCLL